MKFYILGLLKSLKSSLIASLSILSAFLAPIGDLLMFISLMIMVDFITGIIAAKYRNQKRTSLKMFDSVIKFITYIGIVTFAFVFDETISKTFHSQLLSNVLSFFMTDESINTLSKFKLAAAISFIIVVREFKSIDENWYSIRGWSFIETTTTIFNKIKNIADYIIKLKNNK